jgi:hypothetical protein
MIGNKYSNLLHPQTGTIARIHSITVATCGVVVHCSTLVFILFRRVEHFPPAKLFDQEVVGSIIKRRGEQSIYSEPRLVRGKKSDERSGLKRGMMDHLEGGGGKTSLTYMETLMVCTYSPHIRF